MTTPVLSVTYAAAAATAAASASLPCQLAGGAVLSYVAGRSLLRHRQSHATT